LSRRRPLTITAGVRVTDHALAVIGYQQPMARAVGVLLEPSAAVFASDLINIEGYRRGADPVVVDFRQPREFAELGRANAKVAHGQDYRPPIASSRARAGSGTCNCRLQAAALSCRRASRGRLGCPTAKAQSDARAMKVPGLSLHWVNRRLAVR
jgi:hypothetical protein